MPAGVATDAIGNPNAASVGIQDIITYDITPPSVTINQASWQADPTNAPVVHFTVVFSEPVGGFVGADVVLSGTAGATTAVVTGVGAVYDVAISGMTQSGTIIATIPALAGTDVAGNPNLASTSADNVVLWDNVAPTVTINKAVGQADPATASPIHFTAVFSEPVTGFTDLDVVLTGTAGATTVVVTGGGTTYDIAVSGMTSAGTVVASIPGRAASDAAGNGSQPSTSTDNNVLFQGVSPTVVALPQVSQPSPTSAGVVNFSVVFSRPVFGFSSTGIVISGTAGATMALVTGSGTTYNVAVSGMRRTGTVMLAISANAAVDSAGHPNAASAMSAPVIYDSQLPMAALSATTITNSSKNRYVFSVTYTDNIAVNAATVGNGNIFVTGPAGNNFKVAAKWIRPVGGLVNGARLVARYNILPPGGTWDAADNGVYKVVLQYHRIADTAGNRISAIRSGSVLGTFRVNIPRGATIAAAKSMPLASTMASRPLVGPTLFASGDILIGEKAAI